ncbi:hypothetical protein M514_13118, partial [Trichuris suis]
MMNDEEIVEFVSNKADMEEDEEQQVEETAGPSTTIPSNNAAFQYREQGLRWYEAQEECDRHVLICLKSVRVIRAQKREISQKQTRIAEFLKKD